MIRLFVTCQLFLLGSCISLNTYRPANTTTSYFSAAEAAEQSQCVADISDVLLTLPALPIIPDDKINDRVYVETTLVNSIAEHRVKLRTISDKLQECQ